MLPEMQLDDQSFEEIVRGARKKIARIYPEWTDYNEHDPGITFLELLAGLYILRIKYAPLLAALISVIDILPVLGTGTVLVPWAAAELLARDTAAGIGLLVLYAVITVIRNFAEPKIIGKEMGINPLFTLLAMFIGLKLFGFAGILLLPITLIVVVKYYKDEMEAEAERK